MNASSLPSITALGIGSGMDVNSIVQQLVAIESRPLQQLKAAQGKIQTSISTFGELKGLISKLQTSAQKLADPSLWSRSAAQSSNPDVLDVTSGSSNVSGRYTVQVGSMAQAHTLASGVFASADSLVGSGTLDLEVGTWDSGYTAFSAQVTHASIAINVGATLNDVRNLINASDAGVRATIVTDASGARLSLSAAGSGLSHQIRAQVSNLVDDNGLGSFTFAPDLGQQGLTQTQAAQNAQLSINGLSVGSESNTFENVIDGMAFHLKKTSQDPVTVDAGPDLTAVKAAIKEFVDSYNALNGFLTKQTAYDSATKTAGKLQGDSAAIALRSGIRTLLMGDGGASSKFAGLRDIGLSTSKDGTVSIDDGRLSNALGDLTQMAALFSGIDAGDPLKSGFGNRFSDLANAAVGFDGTITARSDGLSTTLQRNQARQDQMSKRIDQYQARLVAQYSALDTKMAQMSSLTNYVTQQISMLTGK